MNKKVTGQMIYEALSALVETGQYCIDDIAPAESQIYPDLAEKLNEQLTEEPEITIDQAIGQLKELGYIYLPQSHASTPICWKVFKSLNGELKTCHDDQSVFDLLNSLQGGLS
jgi:hypothetical protein